MQDVQSWMSEMPETIGAEDSALQALERMIDGGFRHLPVVTTAGDLVGIVSLDDLRAALPFRVSLAAPPQAAERRVANEYTVGELMTYAPWTVRGETPLAEAARELVRRRVGCLPVVSPSGKVVGILTESDALTALASLLPGPALESARQGEMEHLVRELRAERRQVLAQLGRREEVERELSGEGQEPMDGSDRATRLSAVLVEGALADMAARRLTEIDRALARHERAAFGVCEQCGQAIPVPRLRAMPGTARCTRCAE